MSDLHDWLPGGDRLGNTWAEAQRDPFLGASPWYVAHHAPAERVVEEARKCEAAALAALDHDPPWDMSASMSQRFADACWVSAVIAWLEGRA